MKLNKPKVTEAQSVLEAYVTGLLRDCSDTIPAAIPSNAVYSQKNTAEIKTQAKNKIQNKTETDILKVTKIEPSEVIQETIVEPCLDFKQQYEEDPRLKGVEKLLAKISLANTTKGTRFTESDLQKETFSNQIDLNKTTEKKIVIAPEITPEIVQASFLVRERDPLKKTLGDVFQTLVFEVSKLPLAVPLIKLGGIVNFDQQQVTPLVGTPKWFMGLLPHERGNLMVVDTQIFLMPERVHDDKPYDFLIILDDSLWSLACHSVGDAKNLTPDDIRWSAGSSRRPWFAGMVVEYMSALLEVDKLINMLAENIVD